jgi:hypothetical protein
MVQLLATKEIGKLITLAHKSEERMRSNYQSAAVQCIMHAAPAELGGHGDVTLFERLVRGMKSKGLQRAMILWAQEFTLINVGDKTAGFVKGKMAEGRKWDLEGAQATIFADFEPTPPPSKLTLEKLLKMLDALEKKTSKSIDNGNVEDGENNVVLLSVVKAARQAGAQEAVKAQAA